MNNNVSPKNHDYTVRTWGHDYTITTVIDGGSCLHLVGWGHGIENGDYLILPNGDETTRYMVESIKYKSDPSDMWSAKATFAPRQDATSNNGGLQ